MREDHVFTHQLTSFEACCTMVSINAISSAEDEARDPVRRLHRAFDRRPAITLRCGASMLLEYSVSLRMSSSSDSLRDTPRGAPGRPASPYRRAEVRTVASSRLDDFVRPKAARDGRSESTAVAATG